MKWLLGLLTVVFFALQARLWGGDGSFAELAQLRAAIEHQQRDNATFRDRNDALAAEVKDLKEGLDAVEERARRELGMIKDGEVFFQIVDR